MKGLKRLVGGITFGTILFQLGTAICLLSIAYFAHSDVAAEFSRSFAMAQLLGLTLTFGLTSAVVSESDQIEARIMSGVMAILAVAAALLISPLIFVLEGLTAAGIIVLGVGFALCEALRSEAIGSLRIRSVVWNFANLAISVILLGVLFIEYENVLLSFALTSLFIAVFWMAQGHMSSVFLAAHQDLVLHRIKKHWRYFTFRTATNFLDYLSSKGIIILMATLPGSYVVFFFLIQRIFASPVQQLTYALSLSLLRQARSQESLSTRETVRRIWAIITFAGVFTLPLLSAVLLMATSLDLPFTFGVIEAITAVALLLYTFYLSYVTWLGRLFDLKNAQAIAFKVEAVGKLLIVFLMYFTAQNAPLLIFAPTFFLLQVIFGGFWLTTLFYRMNWGLGLLVKGFVLPMAGLTALCAGISYALIIYTN